MGGSTIEWVWNESANVSGVCRYFGTEYRAFGVRIGRRVFGVVLTREVPS